MARLTPWKRRGVDLHAVRGRRRGLNLSLVLRVVGLLLLLLVRLLILRLGVLLRGHARGPQAEGTMMPRCMFLL